MTPSCALLTKVPDQLGLVGLDQTGHNILESQLLVSDWTVYLSTGRIDVCTDPTVNTVDT